MTTRSLLPLDEADRTAILELLDSALAAATTGIEDAAMWRAADEAGHRPSTGYKLARRTWSAGQIAAHALRLATDADTPWGAELSRTAAAINSADWDERTYATLALRKTFKDLEGPVSPELTAVRRVAAWLRLDGGPQLPGATARLCRTAIEQASAELGRAWYATHWRDLLEAASGGQPLSRGRVSGEELERRARLSRAAVAVYEAGDPAITKKALADAAGVTRATLDNWLTRV